MEEKVTCPNNKHSLKISIFKLENYLIVGFSLGLVSHRPLDCLYSVKTLINICIS